MKKHRKNLAVMILAIFTSLAVFPAPALAQETPADMAGHWAENAVVRWVAAGKIGGYSDGTFRPEQAVSRAELVALVNRAMGYDGTGSVTFADVPASAWYYPEVAAAVGEGYIGGFADNTFRADEPVSRAQAAAIAARITGLADAPDRAVFTDQVPQWAAGPVGAVTAAGYMTGYGDGSFQADRALTRAEAVALLDRIAPVMAEDPETLSQQSLTLAAGATATLRIEGLRDGDTVHWSSSDTEVATVDQQGRITAVAEGTAAVTAKIGSQRLTCQVKVVATGGGEVTYEPNPVVSGNTLTTEILLSKITENQLDGQLNRMSETIQITTGSGLVYEGRIDQNSVFEMRPDFNGFWRIRSNFLTLTDTAGDHSTYTIRTEAMVACVTVTDANGRTLTDREVQKLLTGWTITCDVEREGAYLVVAITVNPPSDYEIDFWDMVEILSAIRIKAPSIP